MRRGGVFLVEDSKTEKNFLVGNSLAAGIFLFKIRAQLEFFVPKTRAMKKTWRSGYLLILL